MGENKRDTLPKLRCALLFNITFQVIFSAAKQLQNYTKMQNQQPSTSGSSIVFLVEGDVSHKGFFHASVNIGTPPEPYYLDIDTGSDLTWLQCSPGKIDLLKALQLMEAPHTPYEPNNNFITYSDPTCALMNQQIYHLRDIQNQLCNYHIEYADYGSSLGMLVKDSFQVNDGSDKRDRSYTLTFGCGYHQEFLGTDTPPKVDGVLGLGNGKASIVSQLSDQGVIPKVTGHCLGGQGGGYLFLGNAPVASPGLLRAQMSSQSVKLHDNMLAPADLLYGEQPLDYGLYVAFDSGSTYTYFEFQAYQATLHQVANLGDMVALRVNDLYLPVCWKPRTSAKEFRNQFSSLVLSVKNDDNTNVRFEMTPESYLIASPQGNVCLAILNGYDAGLPNLNIIGDNFMLDKLVIYDYENKQIGWSPSDCKWKSNSRRNFLHAYYLFHVIMLSGLVVPMFLN